MNCARPAKELQTTVQRHGGDTMIFAVRVLIVAFLGVATFCEAAGELRVAGIFANQMVLQREQSVPVWGWAKTGDRVTVMFGDRTHTSTAGADGFWSVTLDPLKADLQGKSLRVDCGEQSVVFEDVLVGEVWHASGQSNMAMTVGAMARELKSVAQDIADTHLPPLRFCRISETESPERRNDLRERVLWQAAEPSNVARFSGVAFYFARRLHRELKVPVGIIDSSRGGTPIEPFIPREAFRLHPVLQQELKLGDRGDRGDLNGIWRLPGGVRARDANWLPGRLFHSRLAPLSRFPVRGAIWYQGESNCGVQEDPREYQHKMRALVRGWRQAFGNAELPVYFVQLPGSGAGDGWPYLREQQRLASKMPKTGMVVTVDLEHAGIHPPNKIDVGERLARWALANDYHQTIAYSGPTFERLEIRRSKMVVHFRHVGKGLMLAKKDGLGAAREIPGVNVQGFEVADSAGHWHSAIAAIRGRTIVVECDTVDSPVAVRYAYAVSPRNCNLYNRDGLPASPFCSRPELLHYDPGLPHE